MSRRGPGYVESEAELRNDLELKQEQQRISSETAEAFIDLYTFAEELGDRVEIGKAKNANFRMYVDAHQGNYLGNPSVFSANVTGLVKIWPAKKPAADGPTDTTVGWELEYYHTFRRAFQSLGGVPQDKQEARFDAMVRHGSVDQFKTVVETFVATCREHAD